MLALPAITFFIIFLCWGSFLNVVAHRLITDESLLYTRSACPTCKTMLTWHDLIPVLSWLACKGLCRHCKKPISFLYPTIELFAACSITALYIVTPPVYATAYFIFFSALIVTIRSDLEHMLISRMVTLYLIPIAFVLSFMGKLPISLLESVIGACGGYFFLHAVRFAFWKTTGKIGMGQGDLDLLALIGSFTGPMGCWTTLLIGSTLGSCVGIGISLIYKPTGPVKIPFGPFLALGAMGHILMSL